jgi:hypothetical protein
MDLLHHHSAWTFYWSLWVNAKISIPTIIQQRIAWPVV